MTPSLSHDAVTTLLHTTDIGGTNAATAWLPMAGFDRIYAYVELSTWDAGDDLDTVKLEQAKDSGGTDSKDLTTSSSTGNYDTDTPIDAAGNFAILEARAEHLDRNNGFTHVRLYVAETGNTGPDLVTAAVIRYSAVHGKPQKQGAAVAGEKVYIYPS